METISRKGSSERVTITVLPDGREVTGGSDVTILRAARQGDVAIDAPCNGGGKCGKCRIRIVEGPMPPPTPAEVTLLRPDEISAGVRLACETRITAGMVVEVPETSRNLAHRKATAKLRRAVPPAPFTRKHCIRVARASIERGDLRADLARLRDEVPYADVDARAVRALPGALREGDHHVTAVLAGSRLIAVEPGDTRERHYGLALDIGTTTIAGYLLDLRTGDEVAAAARPNPQAAFGADIISRIDYAQQSADHLEELRRAVTTAINAILHAVARHAEIATRDIYELVVVGNTCMTHLFLGVDPASLGQAPYAPVFIDSLCLTAGDLGLAMHPCGPVRTLPNIAGFVGADTVGVLAASELETLPGVHVAVDIGTNAEVLISVQGKVVACSTAAGPAFEGAKITHGMRAQPGAIDGVTIGQDLYAHTIDGRRPVGICGSGIIDAIGECVRVGLIEPSGRIAEAGDARHLPEAICARRRDDGIVLVWAAQSGTGADILLTQQDIREIQLVKAAIFAGVTTLLDMLGHRVEAIDSLMIAGAFGTFISTTHAISIGLIPTVADDRVIFLGNAAGIGAKMSLISTEAYAAICAAARRVEYIELAGDPRFTEHFAMAMMLAPDCDG